MNEKVIDIQRFLELRERFRLDGRCVVFTNGCFDIVHRGHIEYLLKAKALGDILVIGLNSDRSVRNIKGDKRPIINENDRALLLASFYFVDYVILFDEDTPEKLIKAIKPDVLVKGADWGDDEIVGADFVRSYGGRVVRVELTKGYSTSAIIEKIVRLYCGEEKDEKRIYR